MDRSLENMPRSFLNIGEWVLLVADRAAGLAIFWARNEVG
jgi:hypothetical protein